MRNDTFFQRSPNTAFAIAGLVLLAGGLGAVVLAQPTSTAAPKADAVRTVAANKPDYQPLLDLGNPARIKSNVQPSEISRRRN